MKIILLLLISLLFWMKSMSQNAPVINLSTTKLLQGSANRNDEIQVSHNGDFISDQSIKVTDKSGDFTLTYTSELPISVKSVIVWKIDQNNNKSDPIVVPVLSSADAILALSKKGNNPFYQKRITGNVRSYKASILNTNFSIPIARFNFLSGNASKKGDILLFNSVGAGFGLSFGELTEILDDSDKVLNQSFKNTIAFHLGVLFSAGTGEDNKNVFAPIFNLSVLDFQIGVGYELGTIAQDQKRPFVTVSYSIPLYKLTNTGFWIWKAENAYSKTFSKGEQ